MASAQQHLSITNIQEDIVLLKDGGAALILQTSAVNFGLLSEREQIAIITGFAQMLNSLSFSIQIVIHSKRLDISSYLKLLDKALSLQTNPLLSQMMISYREFIQSTIKENEVLDKKFYIVIPAYGIEMGIKLSRENQLIKGKTLLLPRRDQVVRQLNRIGLKSDQLTTEQLIKTFFDIYNTQINTIETVSEPQPKIEPVKMAPPPPPPLMSQPPPPQSKTPPTQMQQPQPSRNHPFIVEELEDN